MLVSPVSLPFHIAFTGMLIVLFHWAYNSFSHGALSCSTKNSFVVFTFSLQKKVVVEKEGVKKDISFRKILLSRCQKEFEKEKSDEKRIHEKLEHLSKEGLTVSKYHF